MNKFISAVVLLALTAAVITVNSARMKILCDDLTDIAIATDVYGKDEKYEDTLSELQKLEDKLRRNDAYLGVVCSENVLNELSANIAEAKALIKADETDNISAVLNAVLLNIQQLGKHEFLSIKTLF